MKKSEYRKGRREAWERVIAGGYPSYESVETLVARDEEACNAAGVEWDPEEEPLPEKLYKADLGRGCARVLADGDNGYTAHELTHREADEVKRRYEAWPALESIVSELPDDDAGPDPCRFSCKLHSIRRILRGGAP